MNNSTQSSREHSTMDNLMENWVPGDFFHLRDYVGHPSDYVEPESLRRIENFGQSSYVLVDLIDTVRSDGSSIHLAQLRRVVTLVVSDTMTGTKIICRQVSTNRTREGGWEPKGDEDGAKVRTIFNIPFDAITPFGLRAAHLAAVETVSSQILS